MLISTHYLMVFEKNQNFGKNWIFVIFEFCALFYIVFVMGQFYTGSSFDKKFHILPYLNMLLHLIKHSL